MSQRHRHLTNALCAFEVALKATEDGYESLHECPPRIVSLVTSICNACIDVIDWTRGELSVTNDPGPSAFPKPDLPEIVKQNGSEK
jgi:hypothetical protein